MVWLRVLLRAEVDLIKCILTPKRLSSWPVPHYCNPELGLAWPNSTLLAQTQTYFLIYSESVMQTYIFGNISFYKFAHSAFLLFWIHANLFRDFSDCTRPIFKCFDIIRFVFPLAFQRHIPNCSTIKTRKATAKIRHKVKNNGKGGEGV